MPERVNTWLGITPLKSLTRRLAAVGLFCWFVAAAGATVLESEPNNNHSEANPLRCGDTVYCASLTPAFDLDYFFFYVIGGDSIIVETIACRSDTVNTFIALFDDQDSILAFNDDDGSNRFSHLRYLAPASGNYFISVLNLPGPAVDSAYTLLLQCPNNPPEDYDLCETPRIIGALPYYNEGSTRGATHQCGTASPDVFYALHLPAAGNLFVTVCTNAFDARVQILGRCCGEWMDDASEGCGTGAELISFGLPADDYFIIVEGTSALQYGDFSIEVMASLPGCPAPEPVVLTDLGGYPLLDWPQLVGPGYYIVWQANNLDGPWEHLGVTFQTYFIDSAGYASSRRFYNVTSVCPW
ncbi:MAG: PPC domain-containing protein [Calditrichota bacterium]